MHDNMKPLITYTSMHDNMKPLTYTSIYEYTKYIAIIKSVIQTMRPF